MINNPPEQTKLGSFFVSSKNSQCETVKKRPRPCAEDPSAGRKETLMPGQETPLKVTGEWGVRRTREQKRAASEKKIDALLSGPSPSEKYSYLLSPSVGLPLPYHYKKLYTLFGTTDSTLSYAKLKSIQPLFSSIKEAVENIGKHTLTETHLAQFLHVVPGVYVLHWLGSAPQLLLDFPAPLQLPGRPLPKSELAARKQVFYQRLLQMTKHWYAEYLLSRSGKRPANLDSVRTWHSGFKLHECPAVPTAALPAKPPSEQPNSATQLLRRLEAKREALAEAFGHRSYVLLLLGFFVCGYHVAFIITHMPAYVEGVFGDKSLGANSVAVITIARPK